MTTDKQARFVISVLAHDRPGIIADVSGALYQLGGNLEALSQTVVWHWFTMIICGAFPSHVSAEDVRKSIEAAGEFSATVQPFGAAGCTPPVHGDPFVVTAAGMDKPGIVHRLTQRFARKGININDVWNEVRDGRFIVIFHVTIPPSVDPKDARYDLEMAGKDVGVTVTLQHRDIFTATNSLDVRTKG